jgi:CheY-like chemotaxis protein
MPGMNGPEAFAQMCKLQPDIPVIFVTGYATEADLIGARLQVHWAVLRKPSGAFVLAQKLREVLDRKKRNPLRDRD